MLLHFLTLFSIIIGLHGDVYGGVVKQDKVSSSYKLDLQSVKLVAKKVRFVYIEREVDGITTHSGITSSCSNGKIVSSRPGWIDENTDVFISADSKDKKDFLELVCTRSILSNTEA